MGKKFKGIGCPCVTPFDEEEALDLAKLRELVDFLINSEINAIIPASNCGESYSLTETEYHQLIDTVIDQVNNDVPIYVGVTNRIKYSYTFHCEIRNRSWCRRISFISSKNSKFNHTRIG